jgi:hypothetical protein
MVVMRYRRAVEKLQALAEACDSVKDWPPEDPFLREAYVFGDILRGPDSLECVEVILAVNLPPQEAVWGSSPRGTLWLADRLRLSKGDRDWRREHRGSGRYPENELWEAVDAYLDLLGASGD